MRFLKGDVCIYSNGEEHIFESDFPVAETASVLALGIRLLRTAREEWQRKHDVCSAFAWWEGTTFVCPECGEMPTELRSPDEIAALKAGRGAARAMTREEWDAKHAGAALCGGMRNVAGGAWPSVRTCTVCGPRPPAQPVATEWTPLTSVLSGLELSCFGVSCVVCPVAGFTRARKNICSNYDWTDADGYHFEHRWPSGVVGEGEPEFRRVATEPAPAVVEPEHVHLRELPGDVYSRRHEGPHAECPNCLADFPYEVADRIDAGTLDCPNCGWHSGRCDHCHELLVPSYVVGERDHGRTHCPRCQGVDE